MKTLLCVITAWSNYDITVDLLRPELFKNYMGKKRGGRGRKYKLVPLNVRSYSKIVSFNAVTGVSTPNGHSRFLKVITTVSAQRFQFHMLGVG